MKIPYAQGQSRKDKIEYIDGRYDGGIFEEYSVTAENILAEARRLGYK